jgi:hypothetical protein
MSCVGNPERAMGAEERKVTLVETDGKLMKKRKKD